MVSADAGSVSLPDRLDAAAADLLWVVRRFELAPGRLAGHSLNGVGYVNLDIPPGQSLYHVPLALSGDKTVATLFQGAAKGSKVAILDAETGEWAEGELGDTWSNGAAELGLGSIFKFTNPDTMAFRAVFAGSYPGQGVEVTLAKGTGYFGYPNNKSILGSV